MCYSKVVDALEKLILSAQACAMEAVAEMPIGRTGVLGGGSVCCEWAGKAGRGGKRAIGCRVRELWARHGSEGPPSVVRVDGRELPITLVQTPAGRQVPLLKVMLSTACERNCLYCSFRAGADCRRVTFQPEELAHAFLALHRPGLVDGLFLSSGVFGGGRATQDRLLDTVAIVRRAGFRGYVHLKIMPGAEREQVLQAMQLADRVSVNLEAPNPERLERLAPGKNWREELVAPLEWVEEVRREVPPEERRRARWPSTTTQFVIGPAGESDLEILSAVQWLTRRLALARCYFMAFSPVAGTPLEDRPAESSLRQHRLYQASFLIRDYGVDVAELPFSGEGRLPLGEDPKLALARKRLAESPVEVNQAEKAELLRVPGIGVRAAQAILRARREGKLRDLADLRRLGVAVERARPFVLLEGRAAERQLRLF